MTNNLGKIRIQQYWIIWKEMVKQSKTWKQNNDQNQQINNPKNKEEEMTQWQEKTIHDVYTRNENNYNEKGKLGKELNDHIKQLNNNKKEINEIRKNGRIDKWKL